MTNTNIVSTKNGGGGLCSEFFLGERGRSRFLQVICIALKAGAHAQVSTCAKDFGFNCRHTHKQSHGKSAHTPRMQNILRLTSPQSKIFYIQRSQMPNHLHFDAPDQNPLIALGSLSSDHAGPPHSFESAHAHKRTLKLHCRTLRRTHKRVSMESARTQDQKSFRFDSKCKIAWISLATVGLVHARPLTGPPIFAKLAGLSNGGKLVLCLQADISLGLCILSSSSNTSLLYVFIVCIRIKE
jgi:hypothetical protein